MKYIICLLLTICSVFMLFFGLSLACLKLFNNGNKVMLIPYTITKPFWVLMGNKGFRTSCFKLTLPLHF